jgi:hypothetical protein
MSRKSLKLATTLAIVVASLTGLVETADAGVVGCGQTITQNTVLTADVGPCLPFGTHGIRIATSGITLDLNGHSILGTPQATNEGAGIYLFRVSGVTVKNGTVRDFDGGVIIEGGSGNLVTGMTARDNIGVVAGTRYADGFAILSSTNNRIVGNQAIHNGPLSGFGIYSRVDGEHPRETAGISSGNRIENNRAIDNNLPRSATINDSDGIRVETMSVFNVISGNYSSGSGLDGIAIFSFTPDNTVQYNTSVNNGFLNTFRRRGDGIRVFGGSERTLVQGNTLRGNAANGIIFHGPFGTRPPVTNSQALFNVAVDNNRLPPIEQSELGGPTWDLNDGNIPSCDNNIWRGNRYRTANPPCTTIGGAQV